MPSTMLNAKDGEINGMISTLKMIHFLRPFQLRKKACMNIYVCSDKINVCNITDFLNYTILNSDPLILRIKIN